MSEAIAPISLQNPFVEPADPRAKVPELFITPGWWRYLQAWIARTDAAPQKQQAVSYTGLSAAVALTTLVANPNAGLYRVGFRFRVSTAGGISSSLQFTVTTTEGGVVCTQTVAAYTGNAVNAPQSLPFYVHPDGGTPISFSVAYATAGVPAMAYDLDVICEAL